MATKLGRMITYFDYILPKKLINDHIITCFCEITWQTKNISLFSECLWLPNLGIYNGESPSIKSPDLLIS